MQINVSQQLKGAIGSVRYYDVNEIIVIDGVEYLVQGTVKLLRTDNGILVKGTLNTQSDLTCSRCLEQFDNPLTLEIEEEYFPTIDIVSGSALPQPDDPGAFTIDEHNILDLTEAIRQYTLLAIPMKPLCKADCAGLCPTCGLNLNRKKCDCTPIPADSRWDKLRELASSENKSTAKSLKRKE